MAPPKFVVELRVRVRHRHSSTFTSGDGPEEEEEDRSSRHHPNLFVRLPRVVAHQLHDSLGEVHPSLWNDGSWYGPTSRLGEQVEFLPLKVEFCGPHEGTSSIVVYGSYNGGDVVANGTTRGSGRPRTLYADAADVDEIDLPIDLVPPSLRSAELAMDAISNWTTERPDEKDRRGSSSPLWARVSVAETCRDVEQVRVQAATRDDYALLCHSASYLESGGWLRTVSVVYPYQVLSVPTEDGNDCAQCQVLPNEGDAHQKEACYRLVASTQVVVLPPNDPENGDAEDDSEENVLLSVLPSAFDFNSSMLELATHLGTSILSVGQGRAIVHPNVSPWIKRRFNDDSDPAGFLAVLEVPDDPILHIPDDPQENASTKCRRRRGIVLLQASTLAPMKGIVLHPLIRIDLQLRLFADQIRVWPLSIEQEVSIGRIRDELLLPSPAMSLGVERVVLRAQETEPEWRRPSITVTTDSNCASTETPPCRIDNEHSFWASDEVHDIPIRIGSLFDPSWMGNSMQSPEQSSSQSLCRLILTSSNAHSASSLEEDEYIMAQDVPLLLDVESHESQLTTITTNPAVLNDSLRFFRPNVESSVSILSSWRSSARSCTIVCGEIGSGKTYTALLIAAAAQMSQNRSVVYLDCRRLKNAPGMRLQSIMDELLAVFQLALRSGRSTVILDDLDELIPHVLAGPSSSIHSVQSQNPALVDQCHALNGLLRHMLRSMLEESAEMEIVITGKDSESLVSTVHGDLPVQNSIQLPVLAEEERLHLFHSFLDRLWAQHDTSYPRLCRQVTLCTGFLRSTSGFKPLDLLQIAGCYHRELQRKSPIDPRHLLEDVLRNYVPLNQRRASIETFQQEYSLEDIGGLNSVKDELEETVLRPAKYRRIYQRAKLRLPRGILLFGPPGCGKSYIVPALARDCGYPTILCRGAEIVDKYIGASELKVRELFSRAASVAPSILWIEDLDALAPRRGSDSTGVTDRIVNQLLTFLDGVEDSSSSGTVYVVATSSRPDKIDPALLRPGRLERHLYVGLPEGDDEFLDVIIKLSARFNLSAELKDDVQTGRFLANLKDQVPALLQLSPADVKSAFVTAQIAAAHAAIDGGEGSGAGQDQVPFVSTEQLLLAFRSTKPSLGTKDRTMLDAIYTGFRKLPTIPTGSNGPPTDLKVALM